MKQFIKNVYKEVILIYFIKVKLDAYYKNYNKKEYSLLERLKKYIEEENLNKNFRELKQNEYIEELVSILTTSYKVFVKASIGFKKILIFTPRLLLNEQIVKSKYFNHIGNKDLKIIYFSNSVNLTVKDNKIKKYSKSGKNFNITLNTYLFL